MAGYFIPNSTYEKMAKKGVAEAEVHDVWNNGERVNFSGQNGLKRRYESWGYEIGITYVTMETGQPMITGVWKRPVGKR